MGSDEHEGKAPEEEKSLRERKRRELAEKIKNLTLLVRNMDSEQLVKTHECLDEALEDARQKKPTTDGNL